MTSSIPVFVVSMTLAFAGCKKKEPEPTSLPLASAALQASSAKPLAPPTPGPVASLAVTWTDPAGWVRKPSPNNVRRATYSIPPQVGDSPGAELGVFYFGPGEGGGLEANIQRWIKQFPDAAPSAIHRENRSANGLSQHVVQIDKGSFASGMPGAEDTGKVNWALLGGIVESPGGAVFFKLTGPSKTVLNAKAEFLALLDSVKPAN